jgi:hypothetical protein
MSDIFIEHLVKKHADGKDVALKALIILAFAISVFISLITFPFIILITGFACWYAMSFTNKEYEYIFTNGELDIDVIYNKSRRKRLFTAEVKPFEVMCHISDMGYEPVFSRAEVVRDYSGGKPAANTYMFFTHYKSKRTKIIFEPNDEMLTAFRKYLGTKLKLKS